MPAAGYAITLPDGWVAMTSTDEMDTLIGSLDQEGGTGSGNLLRWRFGYLNIVMDDWPPLYVLPIDDRRTLGCGIQAEQGPQRPASEWVDDIELHASIGPISFVSLGDPTMVDLVTGRHSKLRHVSETDDRQLLHRSTYLIGGDDTEITVTCLSLELVQDEYWEAVLDGFAPLPDGERRIEVPASGFALTVPSGWWVRTRGFGLTYATSDAEQHLWLQHPDGHQCVVWQWDQPPGDGVDGEDLDSFADAFVDAIAIRPSACRSRPPVSRLVRLSASTTNSRPSVFIE